MIEWIIIGGLVVTLYIILYKYEKKMNKMQESINKNKEKIDNNKDKIDKNHGRLDDHYNHFEKLWVSTPKKHTNTRKD